MSGAIGRYEVLAQVAQGGSGTVFKGRAPDGTPVAIKLLHAGRTPARFGQEVQALLRLRHEHVVSLLDAGTHQGALYLVLEWVEGVTLEDRLVREGPLDPRQAAALVRLLALALDHCHAQGVLHRDLKPANVLLRAGSGAPLLTDFGLARDLDASVSGTTLAGQFLGTPGWWPPEQARGDKASVGPRSDVYGLGGLLYSALTGLPPHEGTSLQEMLEPTLPAPPGTRRGGIPAWLDAACLRALATDPADRPASAGELARELAWPAATRGGSARAILLAFLALLFPGALAWALLGGAERPPADHPPVAPTIAPPPARTPIAKEWATVLGHRSFVHLIAVRADSRVAVTTGQGGTVLVWRLAEPISARSVALLDTKAWSMGVAFDPRRPELVWVASYDGRVAALDVETCRWGEELPSLPGIPWMLGFWPDGRLVASTNDGTLHAWEPGPRGAPRLLADPSLGPIFTWERRADGRLLVSGGRGAALLAEGERLRAPFGGLIAQSLFLPDGRVVVAGEHGLHHWDPRGGSHGALRGPARINSLAYSADGRSLFAGGWDGVVTEWDALTLAHRGERIRFPPDKGVNALATTPDGRLLILGTTAGEVAFFQLPSFSRLEGRQAHPGPVLGLIPVPGGDVASWSDDGMPLLWDVGDLARGPRRVLFERPVAGMALLPSGARAFLEGDGALALKTGPADPARRWPERVHTVAASPREDRLAVVEVGGRLRLLLGHDPADALVALTGRACTAVAWDEAGILHAGTSAGELARIDPSGEERVAPLLDGPIAALAPAPGGVGVLGAGGELAWATDAGPVHRTRLPAPSPGLAVDAARGRVVTIDPPGARLAVRRLETGLPLVETFSVPAGERARCLLVLSPGVLLVGTEGGRLFRCLLD